ncbi:MAG: hypothetical protein ABWY33_04680 [Cellulomonas sp.]
MPRNPTIRAAGAAASVAAVGWLLSGVVRATLSGSTVGSGALVELLVPSTGGSLVHTSVPRLVLAGLVGTLVVGAVTGGVAFAALRTRGAARAAVVLACWCAAVLGSVGGQLVSGVLVQASPVIGYDLPSALWTGPYWGVLYGWVVGLVVVAVLRRAGITLPSPEPVRAQAAAVTAGFAAGVGWALVGLLHRGAPPTRLLSIVLSNSSTDYLEAPGAAPVVAYVLATVVVGVVAALVTGVAARSVDLVSGRVAFVLAGWLGVVLAASAGPVVTALGYVVGTGDDWSLGLVLNVLAATVPTNALWGLLYGWLVALAALAALLRVNPTPTPAAEPHQPAHRAP